MDNFAHFSLSSVAENGMLPFHNSPSLSPSASPSMNGRIAGPIRRGSITTSRNGNNARLLGPFFCRWEDCMLCDHAFATGDAIWRHIETEHLSSRLQAVGSAEPSASGLTCRWVGCDEVRPSLFRLKSHMKKHLDWRPFGCELCDERFKHRGDQKKHLARKHPDATPLRPRAGRSTASRVKEERERRLSIPEDDFSCIPPSQPCDAMPEYSFTHSAPPTFSGPLAPPPALSDYAFTAVSAASPISAPMAPNGMNDHRSSLMTMMEAAGHFAMSPDFSSMNQPGHGYQQFCTGSLPNGPNGSYIGQSARQVCAFVPLTWTAAFIPVRVFLLNIGDKRCVCLRDTETQSPSMDDHYYQAQRPSMVANNTMNANGGDGASFSELVQGDNAFDNVSHWLPLLEGKIAMSSSSDSDDSDNVSVKSLGSTVSANSFDHPLFSSTNMPSPMIYGKCDPAYNPLSQANFPIMPSSARKLPTMLQPMTTTTTTVHHHHHHHAHLQ
ncbi:hypothetical protein BDF19DRAFT_413888 [Syncephalis fuscata]|nr:hypothetical protein BDF19DRAFT_413888 [Syncephalis fuscata]